MITLADRLTLARLVLAPAAVAAYLLVPTDHMLCFWAAGLTCLAAEVTDWIDGKVARARNEVSDFGKLADPFCDVFYRIALFVVLLLPAGGTGYPADGPGGLLVRPLVFAVDADTHALGAGFVPFVPVLLMILRELVAGALRGMAASRGLVLAARASGKAKAWMQGFTICTVFALPAFTFRMDGWHLVYAAALTWICAVLSIASITEYIWVNRPVLKQLVEHRERDDR